MKYKIIHETLYSFSSEVFLEPHYLRFKPKITPHSRLISYKLDLSPQPTGISEHTDPENNIINLCWFDGTTRTLAIRSEALVQNEVYNPLNFILYPSRYFDLPFSYPEELNSMLRSSLLHEKPSGKLIEYGENIRKTAGLNTLNFLTTLTRQINSDFRLIYRHEGTPYNPAKTFDLKKGSCRDLAWMQIQLLRYFGIASRFVSGYYYIPLEKPDYELHGWVEVFLPGAGWIGFDPSNGIMVGSTHIPIATSSDFENTMPVTGNIRGSASSELSTKLFIEESV